MDYAKRVEELLKEKGMNVNELATACNVTPSTIYSLLKRNSKKMNVELAMSIAHAFDMTLDEFISDGKDDGKTENDEYVSDFEHQLIKAYRNASDKDKSIVCMALGIEKEKDAPITGSQKGA